MKAFLEEYGLVIVIVIVVAMLILVATLVAQDGKKQMSITYNTFTETGTKALSEGTGGSISTDTTIGDDTPAGGGGDGGGGT